MALVSASEGIGVVLLVPLLAKMDASGGSPKLAGLADIAGMHLGLGALLIIFVVLVLLRALLQYARTIHAQRLSFRLADGLRLKCFSLLLGADWRVLSSMRQSDNASLIVTNIDRLAAAFQYIVSAAGVAVTLAALGATAFLLSPWIALLAGLGGLLVAVAYRGLRRRAVQLGETLGTAYEQLFARISESLGALRLIKGFGAERRAGETMQRAMEELRRAELAYRRSAGRGQAVLQTAGAAVLALACWLAIERFGMPPATLLPLIAIFVRAVPLLGSFQENWQNWLHATPAIADIDEAIERLEREAEPPLASNIDPPALRNEIALENISFRHGSRRQLALDDVSFTLRARSITALVGPSGAGKSTLADVLSGLLAPDTGRLLIDGIALDPAMRVAWRRSVAYVQQEPILFHETVRENLRWANPDADDTAMRQALSDAAAEFVTALPLGLDTVVGDRGGLLSGGERQRISLARALLRQPALLILDEPTSALDAESEANIVAALEKLRGRLTILVIAHRGALAGIADRTITLRQGRIASIAE